jgi:hypothetical protein
MLSAATVFSPRLISATRSSVRLRSPAATDIEARISVQADVVADYDRRIAQIEAAVDKTAAKGRAAAMQLAADQRRNRG